MRHRALDVETQFRQALRQVLGLERQLRTAIIPQPMSTPTAAGMMAPLVGITEPTVAPLPRCTSGIDGNVVVNERQPGDVEQLPTRGILDGHAVDPGLDGRIARFENFWTRHGHFSFACLAVNRQAKPSHTQCAGVGQKAEGPPEAFASGGPS